MGWSVLFCVGVLLTGCAAKEDTVVLLDKVPGNRGAVIVETPGQSSTLTVPRDGVILTRAGMTTHASTAADVQDVFASVLAPMAAGRTYHILFEAGEQKLSPGDEKIIAMLMADVTANPPAEVVITGFTDTVGASESNDRLSQSRAVAVREALIQRGLNASLVRTVGRGERDLRIPTADEVPEKRNRRVEVLVR